LDFWFETYVPSSVIQHFRYRSADRVLEIEFASSSESTHRDDPHQGLCVKGRPDLGVIVKINIDVPLPLWRPWAGMRSFRLASFCPGFGSRRPFCQCFWPIAAGV
jgi:hypothetical protein